MSNYDFKGLSHADLQKTWSICEQLHAVDSSESFVEHSFGIMRKLVDHTHFSAEHFLKTGQEALEAKYTTVHPDLMDVAREHLMEHPCAQRIMARTTADVEAVHRVPNYKEFQKSTLYNEFNVPTQAHGLQWISLQFEGQLLLCAHARETDFTEAETAMLKLVQPHLQFSWEGWMRERKLKQELTGLKQSFHQTEEEAASAAQIRARIAALPTRQREVVELVAMGRDNQQIADELKISVLTVKKHLQLIFQTLNVRHRTELAAKWYKGHAVII